MTATAGELQAMMDASLRRRGAAGVTIEALMYALRERGTAALSEPDCQRRLFEMTVQQLRDVAVRLQKLKPEIVPAWTVEQIKALYEAKARL